MKKFVILLLLLSTLFNCTILNDKEKSSRDEGKIVFSMPENSEGSNQIYKINPDGSGQKKLTNIKDGEAFNPDWSPDGKQIVFTTNLKSTSVGLSLYLMDANGGNKRPMKLLPDNKKIAYSGGYPSWSPDGEKIIYSFCIDCNGFGLNEEIFIYDISKDSIRQLFEHPARDYDPKWSPNGEYIAFGSNRDYYTSKEDRANSDIYLIDADGTDLRRLTNTGNAGRQLWFSSGEELLYWSENQLFRLYIDSGRSERIPVTLSSEMGFRPLSLVGDDEKVLLQVFSYEDSQEEHSLYLLNLTSGVLTNIKSSRSFSGASWYDDKK